MSTFFERKHIQLCSMKTFHIRLLADLLRRIKAFAEIWRFSMHFSGCRKIHVGGAESLEEI